VGFDKRAVEELSALHSEPDWLRARRLESFSTFERMGLPDTRTDEEWRQVDLKPLNLDALRPFEQPDGNAAADSIPEAAAVLGQRGTSSEAARSEREDAELARKGVLFGPLWAAARDHRDLVERRLFSAVRADRDKFAALHAALFSGGTFLYVPDDVTLDQPLISQYWATGAGSTALPHTLVLAGKRSRFQYVDEFIGPTGEAPSLVSGSAEVFLDEGADVGYVAVQRWGNHAWEFANQRFHVGPDARLRMVDVALGGRFARLRVDVIMDGPGGQAELKGLFFGTGEQAFDFRTLQDHLAPHTQSDLLFKGALRDRARSVYVGSVRVEKDARGTSANQANRNLLLSEHAKATSEPILEILNNDILRCSHGATVGPVDPEHLFYLTSRGIPGPVAQRMLVEGFLAEVLDRVPVQHVRHLVERELATRIG
jgi:Fe-S cluster assembly protein SufD